MPEELGTRDVLQQVDARLSNLEQNASQTRSEMNARFDRLGDTLRAEMAVNSRWQIGLLATVWLSLMATIWFRT